MKKNLKKTKTCNNFFSLFGNLIFAAMFIYLIYHMSSSMDLLLDDDMSAELILSELLSRERAILSKSWFYSTELRVFNMQLIFTPLFSLGGG